MAQRTKRLLTDLREILTSTFEDSPPIYVVDESSCVAAPSASSQCPSLLALVVGPPGTPYAHCFFQFRIRVTDQYPNECPLVEFLTTDSCKTRLNPNLYANGKVCLSILGTWPGESSDTWRSTYSILYVLRCLQAMVLTGEPFCNEPGFDEHSNRYDKHLSAQYTQKIEHESIRIGILQVLESLLGLENVAVGHMPLPRGASVSPAAPSPLGADGTPGLTECGADDAREMGTQSPEPLSSTTPATAGTPFATMTTTASDTNEVQWSPAAADGPQWSSLYGTLPHPVALRASAKCGDNPASAVFAPLLKRYIHVWGDALEDVLADRSRHAVNDLPFTQMPFEMDLNSCNGFFQYEALQVRLRDVTSALLAEERRWQREGVAASAGGGNSHYLAQVMRSELAAFDVPSVTATLVDDCNFFHWSFVIMNPSAALFAENRASCINSLRDDALTWDVYEQSMYTVEATFCPSDSREPPRLRFVQPIFHPNISPRRFVPYCFAKENAVPHESRYTPKVVALQLLHLLALPPLPSATAALNAEAAKLCFSSVEADRKAFARQARQLAERTLD